MSDEPDDVADGDDAEGRELCEECGGNGWVYDPSDGGTMTCPNCDGVGRL